MVKGGKATTIPEKGLSVVEALAKMSNKDLSIKLTSKEKELVKKVVAEEKKAASSSFVVRCSAIRT